MNRSKSSLLYFQLPTGMTALTVNMPYLGIAFFSIFDQAPGETVSDVYKGLLLVLNILYVWTNV